VSWPTAQMDSLKGPGRYTFVGGPFGSELTTRDYVSEGIPVIRGNNLARWGKFHDDDFVFVKEEKAAALQSNLAYPGDLIFTQRGTLGQVGLIPQDAKFDRYLVSQSQMKLTVDGRKVNPLFIYYYFRLPSTIQNILNSVSSSGVPHINLSTLKAFQIPVPPLPVQDSILGLVKPYDDLIENNRRRIGLLEEAARLLYREWFVYFRFPGHEHVKITNGLPDGWESRTFDDVCQAVGGGTPSTAKPEYWSNGDITWYTPTDVTRNPCLALLDSAMKITESGLRGSSAKMLPAGTVLMTSRASVGFFGIIDAPSCTNQGFISIIPNETYLRMYLLQNLVFRVEEIRSNAGGSTYKEISRGKFKVLPVVVPGEPLLQEFEEQASDTHAQVRTLHAMNQRLAEARDLLLPRLMSGEIAV
jgi:type I restriction enzyme, S subunit